MENTIGLRVQDLGWLVSNGEVGYRDWIRGLGLGV